MTFPAADLGDVQEEHYFFPGTLPQLLRLLEGDNCPWSKPPNQEEEAEPPISGPGKTCVKFFGRNAKLTHSPYVNLEAPHFPLTRCQVLWRHRISLRRSRARRGYVFVSTPSWYLPLSARLFRRLGRLHEIRETSLATGASLGPRGRFQSGKAQPKTRSKPGNPPKKQKQKYGADK